MKCRNIWLFALPLLAMRPAAAAEDPERFAAVGKWKLAVSVDITGSENSTARLSDGKPEKTIASTVKRSLRFERVLLDPMKATKRFRNSAEVVAYYEKAAAEADVQCKSAPIACEKAAAMRKALAEAMQSKPDEDLLVPLVDDKKNKKSKDRGDEFGISATMKQVLEPSWQIDYQSETCALDYTVDDHLKAMLQDATFKTHIEQTITANGHLERGSTYEKEKVSGCSIVLKMDLRSRTYGIAGPFGIFHNDVPMEFAHSISPKNEYTANYKFPPPRKLAPFGLREVAVKGMRLPDSGLSISGEQTIEAGVLKSSLPFMTMQGEPGYSGQPIEAVVRWTLTPLENRSDDIELSPLAGAGAKPRRSSRPEASVGGQPDMGADFPPPLVVEPGKSVPPMSPELSASMAEYGGDPGKGPGLTCMIQSMEWLRRKLKDYPGGQTAAMACTIRSFCEKQTGMNLDNLADPLISRYVGAPTDCDTADGYKNAAARIQENQKFFKTLEGMTKAMR